MHFYRFILLFSSLFFFFLLVFFVCLFDSPLPPPPLPAFPLRFAARRPHSRPQRCPKAATPRWQRRDRCVPSPEPPHPTAFRLLSPLTPSRCPSRLALITAFRRCLKTSPKNHNLGQFSLSFFCFFVFVFVFPFDGVGRAVPGPSPRRNAKESGQERSSPLLCPSPSPPVSRRISPRRKGGRSAESPGAEPLLGGRPPALPRPPLPAPGRPRSPSAAGAAPPTRSPRRGAAARYLQPHDSTTMSSYCLYTTLLPASM